MNIFYHWRSGRRNYCGELSRSAHLTKLARLNLYLTRAEGVALLSSYGDRKQAKHRQAENSAGAVG